MKLNSTGDGQIASVVKVVEKLAFELARLTTLDILDPWRISQFSVRLFRHLQSPGAHRNAAGLVLALETLARAQPKSESAHMECAAVADYWIAHCLGISPPFGAPPFTSPEERLGTLRHLSHLLQIKLPPFVNLAWADNYFRGPSPPHPSQCISGR
jgi:hypothetical protein